MSVLKHEKVSSDLSRFIENSTPKPQFAPHISSTIPLEIKEQINHVFNLQKEKNANSITKLSN